MMEITERPGTSASVRSREKWRASVWLPVTMKVAVMLELDVAVCEQFRLTVNKCYNSSCSRVFLVTC